MASTTTTVRHVENANQEETDDVPKIDLLAGCPKLGLLTDRYGNSFYVGNAGPFWFPPFPIGPDNDYRRHVTKITNMDVRHDDILVCSYPKAGLHWNLEILNMLINKTSELCTENLFFKHSLDLNPNPPGVEEDPRKPRIMDTHVHYSFLPKQAMEKKIKFIYLVRNPKDVMVAFYNHMSNHNPPLNYPGTFEQFVRLTLDCGYYYGSWFEHTMSFQRGFTDNPDVPFFTVVYEDMVKDPVGEIKRLNTFLGTECSDDLCVQIADACHIDKMKPLKEAHRSVVEKAMFKEGTTSFYRKGLVGDWKNWFSPEFNQEFQDACDSILDGCRIKFQYE